jgi:hypothetical protein
MRSRIAFASRQRVSASDTIRLQDGRDRVELAYLLAELPEQFEPFAGEAAIVFGKLFGNALDVSLDVTNRNWHRMSFDSVERFLIVPPQAGVLFNQKPQMRVSSALQMRGHIISIRDVFGATVLLKGTEQASLQTQAIVVGFMGAV